MSLTSTFKYIKTKQKHYEMRSQEPKFNLKLTSQQTKITFSRDIDTFDDIELQKIKFYGPISDQIKVRIQSDPSVNSQTQTVFVEDFIDLQKYDTQSDRSKMSKVSDDIFILRDENGKYQWTLGFSLKINHNIVYNGIFAHHAEKKLLVENQVKEEIKRQDENNEKYITLYKGPCKSKNAFSCLDASAKYESTIFIEPIYKR